MKKTLILLGVLTIAPLAKAQIVLEALDAPDFTPSDKCLERVKDRNYGDGDHNFIYCAVQGPNGKKWLNLNLGAEYAKENSPYFNPEAQPVNVQDWKAFGNLFQTGRKADGHEIVTYLTDTDPDPTGYWKVNYKYPFTDIPQDIYNSNNQPVANSIWYKNDKSTLNNTWAGTMLNNPCPENYRVMTASDVLLFIPNNSPDIDVSQQESATSPAIIKNKKYPNLALMLSPVIRGYDWIEHEWFEKAWENPMPTETRRINAPMPGTAGIHLGDRNARYSYNGAWTWNNWSFELNMDYALSYMDSYMSNGNRFGVGVDIYHAAVRCIEK